MKPRVGRRCRPNSDESGCGVIALLTRRVMIWNSLNRETYSPNSGEAGYGSARSRLRL